MLPQSSMITMELYSCYQPCLSIGGSVSSLQLVGLKSKDVSIILFKILTKKIQNCMKLTKLWKGNNQNEPFSLVRADFWMGDGDCVQHLWTSSKP